MPYVKIQTNQRIENKEQVLKKLSKASADALGKPETYVMTAFDPETEMTFGGSGEPVAFIQCKSIGLKGSQTENISSVLCSFCETELNVPQDRVYIEFTGAVGEMWGWKGSTF